MKVSIEELRRAALVLLDHVEASGQTEFEITEDHYWDVPAEERYSSYEAPTQLTLGQLSDDWSWITQMIEDRAPISYGLVWLAAVLRRVGEKAV